MKKITEKEYDDLLSNCDILGLKDSYNELFDCGSISYIIRKNGIVYWLKETYNPGGEVVYKMLEAEKE